jgi:hypothetical protein
LETNKMSCIVLYSSIVISQNGADATREINNDLFSYAVFRQKIFV